MDEIKEIEERWDYPNADKLDWNNAKDDIGRLLSLISTQEKKIEEYRQDMKGENMLRPGFTVETTTGMNFDANHLTICWDSGWCVSFICSGCLTRMPVDLIKAIRFSKEGPTYCNECDGPVPRRG